MKVFISSLVLLSLLVGVFCTTAIYAPIERTITTGASFLTDQRLPACSEVFYTISNLNSLHEGDLISILFVPRTDNNTPPPNSTVSIGLYSSNGTDIIVSSVINQTYNSIPYLSQEDGCSIDFFPNGVRRDPGNANSGCGLNYYCSGIKNQTTGLKIRISTSGSENYEGILFDLSVQVSSVSIASFNFDSVFTATVTPPAGSQLFKPTVAQKHYKVYVGPTQENIYSYANFLSAKNSMTNVRFSLSNLKVNGVSAKSDQGLWSLSVNYNDISHADADFLLATDPQQPCIVGTASDEHFYNSTNTVLNLDVASCDLAFGYYYISVGMPQTSNTTYTYDLLVNFAPMEDAYVPVYKNLSVNNPINDIVADYFYDLRDAPALNFYLLNITTSNFAKGDYFFVTLTGINYGSATIQITQGCYGHDISCGDCVVIAECNQFNFVDYTPDEGYDYCKLKVDPCAINVSNDLPFFVTVIGNQFESNWYSYYKYYDYNYISYTISLDIIHSTALDITTFAKTIGNGWVEYTYSGKVNEQEYNHFVMNFNLPTVTEFYLLSAHMFVDQEKDEVVFAHNVGSLAGSGVYVNVDPYNYYGDILPVDNCYGNDYSCSTNLKIEFNSDYAFVDQSGSCRATLPYCDIIKGSAHYFSVYGIDSSPSSEESQILNQYGIAGLGYNRPVDYTIVWRLFTAPITLQDSHVVNAYVNLNDLTWSNFYYSNGEYYNEQLTPNLLTNTYTPQYKYTVPSGVMADSVRILISDINTIELNTPFFEKYRLAAKCGNAAGSCPCFENDYTCSVFTDDSDGCEIYFPLCECDGPIYISVQSRYFPHGVGTFTLAAFAQTSELKATIDLSQNPVSESGNLVPNTGFNPITVSRPEIVRPHLEFQQFYFLGAIIYAADLYVIPEDTYSSTTSLRFTMKYLHTPGKEQNDQFAILSIGNGVIPPTSPFLTECAYSCIATPGHNYFRGDGSSYCTINIPPCELGSFGDIYVRVYGVMPNFYERFFDPEGGYYGYPNDLSNAGITYTVNVAQDNYSPLALLINTPHYDRLFETQSRHYSVVLPKIPAALNIFMYRNSDDIGDLVLYFNPTSLAGDAPCYNYAKRCQIIEKDIVGSSACEIFIPMCEYTQYAGKTVYMSVKNENNNTNRFGWYSEIQHVPGGLPLEYTIEPEISVFQTLDLNKGYPVTGNLRSHQEAYYTFTITQADIDAGKIFNVELDSVEPNLGASLVTYITTSNPANRCGCGGAETLDIDFFRYRTYTCELLGNAGTYYIVVTGTREGVTYVDPFSPVSYTLRAWFAPPVVPIQNLTLSETIYTIPPFPLNINQFIIYKLEYTKQVDSLLYIEIADLQSTLGSVYANGIEAVLNFGHPGSDSDRFSLFGGNQQCFERRCFAQNLETEPLPVGTVMCRFLIGPCDTTSDVTTIYVTVFPQNDAPEPRIQYRANFTIRAFTKTVPPLDFFPDSTTYRNNALSADGYSFTINNLVNPTIQCDTRFGTTVWGDYYFKLSPILVNTYEKFTITNSELNNNTYMLVSNGRVPSDFACGCAMTNGSSCVDIGCTVGDTNYELFSYVGYNFCSGEQTGNVNGIIIDTQIFTDRFYTQLPTIQVTINKRINNTLSPGQFVVLQFNYSQVALSLSPVTTYSLKLSNDQDAAERTCFSTSIPIQPNSAVIFPGNVADESSYCSFCNTPIPSTPIFPSCCVDPNEIAYLTIYNPVNSGVSFSYEYEVIVNYLATNYSELTLPIHTSYLSVGPTYPITFSFDLQSAVESVFGYYEYVLNLRFRSSNGTAEVYLNAFSAALPNSDCTSPMYSCLTSDSDECIIQVPACELASWAKSHNLYEMYVAIVSHTANAFVGTVNVDIFVQTPTLVTLPSTTPFPSSFVPDETYVPLEYYSFFKYQIDRNLGELKLADNKAGYKVSLIPTGSPNNLEISIHYPYLTPTNRNPLAGSSSSGNAATCQYSHDPQWHCYHSNDIGGVETRVTLGNVGVTCLLYFCENTTYSVNLFEGRYIFISVQNVATTNRVVSNFQLNLDYNYVDTPSTDAVFTLTTDAPASDKLVNCSSTQTNVSGCNYVAGSATTAYFYVNTLNISSWGVNDYLVFNITDFTNDINVSVWSESSCEPSTSAITCTEGTECFLQFDPCTYASLYRSDPGNNKYVSIPKNIYLRITGLKPSTTFTIQTPRISPYTVTIPLTSTQLTYSETFVSWDRHYTMFNFIVPKDDVYDFRVSVTPACTTDANRVIIYKNFKNGFWASNACRDSSLVAPVSTPSLRCEAQGNIYLTVYIPPGTVKYEPIEIPEGNYTPQVRFSISASIRKGVFPIVDYCWECQKSVPVGITNFIVNGDNENFGTTMRITLTANNTLSMRVISPLYRETTLSTSTESFLDGIACTLPSCTSKGVYCCDNTVYLNDTTQYCTINVPACDYRNGRFFIITDVDGPGLLTSKIYRQDYPILSVGESNNYQLTVQGEIPIGPNRRQVVRNGNYLGNDDGSLVPYYQFYKIVTSGNPSILEVKVQAFIEELIVSETGILYDYLDFVNNGFFLLPELVVSLKRAEDSVTTSVHCTNCTNCETSFCQVATPGVCLLTDENCVASAYYLSVSFSNPDLTSLIYEYCDLIQYEITVTTRISEPISETLMPYDTLSICGTVQGLAVNYNNYRNYNTNDDDGEDDYDLDDQDNYPPIFYVFHDEEAETYPRSQTYYVDTSSVGEHDDVIISYFIRPIIDYGSVTQGDIVVSVSTQNPATPFCNDCYSVSDTIEYDVVNQIMIVCGNLTQSGLWVTVTAARHNMLVLDYSLLIATLEYPVMSTTIPNLTPGIPAAVKINTTSSATFPFNTNHQFAIVSEGQYFASGINYNHDCISGCPPAESGCTFLGSQDTYYMYQSTSTNVDVQLIHTVDITTTTSLDATVYAGGYELVYVPYDSILEYSVLEIFFTSSTGALQADIGRTGFTAGSGCINTVEYSFNTTGIASIPAAYRSDCDATSGLYITIYQTNQCDYGAIEFTLGFNVNPLSTFLAPVSLPTTNQWVAGTIPLYGLPNPVSVLQIYEIQPTNSEAIVFNIANVNNSLTDSFLVTLGTGNCQKLACNTTFGMCSLTLTPVDINTVYYALVSSLSSQDSSFASGISYRVQASNNFPRLETTINNRYQVLPRNVNVYKVYGRQNGTASGDIQSVVITAELIDGNPIIIAVSDQPNFSGWRRSKICDFGTCTLEFPTRASHPGFAVFYVSVRVDTSVTFNFVKPSNYRIYATTGLRNCESTASFISGFCLSTIKTLSNVYRYRDADARNDEAQSRVESLSCKCPTPRSECVSSLTRFSCLESFRECDTSGFWTPLCRNECENVEESCGPWHSAAANCTCERPEFSCGSSRYSDDVSALCTGKQAPTTPTASASPLPSPSRTPSASSVPASPLASASSAASASPSPSELPEPSDNDTYRTYIIVNSGSTLSFSIAVLVMMVVFLFV